MMRLVFVHGWSVTNTDTYGQLPAALVANAPKNLQLVVEHLYLGRYVSFSDEVAIDDIARGMHALCVKITQQLRPPAERHLRTTAQPFPNQSPHHA